MAMATMATSIFFSSFIFSAMLFFTAASSPPFSVKYIDDPLFQATPPPTVNYPHDPLAAPQPPPTPAKSTDSSNTGGDFITYSGNPAEAGEKRQQDIPPLLLKVLIYSMSGGIVLRIILLALKNCSSQQNAAENDQAADPYTSEISETNIVRNRRKTINLPEVTLNVPDYFPGCGHEGFTVHQSTTAYCPVCGMAASRSLHF